MRVAVWGALVPVPPAVWGIVLFGWWGVVLATTAGCLLEIALRRPKHGEA